MTMTEEKNDEARSAEQAAVDRVVEPGLLDQLMARVDAGEVQLTGDGGFLPEMIKTVVEAGLAAELTEHLGYEKGDPVGRGTPNEPCSDGRNAWWVYVNMWTAEGGGSDLVVVGVVWDDEESVLLEIFDVYVM